uniref:SWIB domain-containing protein n=1 Tax=Panagrellus redivivus TaxID=6233 RepID=A0A7E4V2K0_PANRE
MTTQYPPAVNSSRCAHFKLRALPTVMKLCSSKCKFARSTKWVRSLSSAPLGRSSQTDGLQRSYCTLIGFVKSRTSPMASSSTSIPADVLSNIRAAIAAREQSTGQRTMHRGSVVSASDPIFASSSKFCSKRPSKTIASGGKAPSKRPSQAVYYLLHNIEESIPEFGNGLFPRMLATERRMDAVISRHLTRARSKVARSVPTAASAIMVISHKRYPIPDIPGHLKMNILFRPHDADVHLTIPEFVERLEINFHGEEAIAPAYWDPTIGFEPGSHGFTIPRFIAQPCTATIDVYIKDDVITPIPAFARLIGLPSGTYEQVKSAFFTYVTRHKLSNPVRHGINCDVYLAALFKKTFIPIGNLKQELYTQFKFRGPLQFNYAITEESATSDYYKIEFRTPAVVDALRRKFVRSAVHTPQSKNVDDKLCDIAKNAQNCEHARKFYELVAENPHSSFLKIQKAYVEDFKDANTLNYGNQVISASNPSSFFKESSVMKEAVSRYMHNTVKQKTFEISVNLANGDLNNNNPVFEDREKSSPDAFV